MSPDFQEFQLPINLLRSMGTAVLGPQEIPGTLRNSYLIAKIWIEILNLGILISVF